MSATRILLGLLTDALADEAEAYPLVAPQNALLPFITVTQVHEGQQMLIDGATDMFQSRLSIACHARSAAGADGLAESVKAALDYVANREVVTGSPAAPVGRVTVWKEGTDVSDYSDDRSVFRRTLDFRLRWERNP